MFIGIMVVLLATGGGFLVNHVIAHRETAWTRWKPRTPEKDNAGYWDHVREFELARAKGIANGIQFRNRQAHRRPQ